MTMIKKNLLTVVGIILSFMIAAFGWVLTSKLMDIEAEKLLSGLTTFWVDIPATESVHLDEENDYPLIKASLTEDEIISIRKNWALTDFKRPHEPAAGQLTMEEAIESGKKGVNFLSEKNILPSEFSEFDNVGAILSQNIPQDESFLPLEYSYWVVNFSNADLSIVMMINAVTGQIWDIEITASKRTATISPPRYMMQVSHDDILPILAAFTTALEIHPSNDLLTIWENSEFLSTYSDSIVAYQSFANGKAAIIIDAISEFAFTPTGELSFSRLNIFIMTT